MLRTGRDQWRVAGVSGVARRTLSPVTSRPTTGPPPGLRAATPPDLPATERPAEGTTAADSVTPASAAPHPDPHPVRPTTNPSQTTTPSPGAAHETAGVEPSSAPLAGDLPAERHRLSPRVTSYWRWRAFFSALPLLALLASLAVVVPWGPWWAGWGIVGVALAAVILAVIILPPIRYRVFWYAISTTEIDVQHGIIFVKRSVVPMHRVQNLRTERGPMADHYGMTNLKIKTAAGSVNISGLGRREADELCDRISALADVADDV